MRPLKGPAHSSRSLPRDGINCLVSTEQHYYSTSKYSLCTVAEPAWETLISTHQIAFH